MSVWYYWPSLTAKASQCAAMRCFARPRVVWDRVVLTNTTRFAMFV